MMVLGVEVNSLELYIHHIKEHRNQWGSDAIAWFRGEPVVDAPLLPKVYRPKSDNSNHHEIKLLHMFRMKAATFSSSPVPLRENTDQWLFLAQHVGLPTRLLDWTESALVALYFALGEKKPVVWMLEPLLLNRQSTTDGEQKTNNSEEFFPLTWFDPGGGIINIGVENIKAAWQKNNDGIKLPVAVVPTYVHPRMSAQRSVFTIHGSLHDPLSKIVPKEILRRFTIDPQKANNILNDLHLLGIHESTAFPDLDGLAKELSILY